MSLSEYSDFVYRAGFLHLPDPVEAWRQFYQRQEKCVEYLNQKRILQFQSPPNRDPAAGRLHDGTDITFDVTGRTWLNRADGENFPDGELDSGPRSVDGVLNLTHPTIYHGKQVEGIRLEFRGGKVVDASATRNQDYLIALLDSDAGARVAGEIGIGTNYHLTRFINNSFFDEKIGGTFHLALGAGYPQTGNANESSIHWDLVSDLRSGGSITADDELLQKDGRFVLQG
jgi:aminopeptidase